MDVKEQIKESLAIETVIGEHVSLRPKNGRLWGLCPFHKEKTPSFTVSPDIGIFHCFGCNKSGDIFTFVQEYDNLSFKEALELLAQKANITVPQYQKNQSQNNSQQALNDLYNRLNQTFKHLLNNSPQGKIALEYALKRTGSAEMVETYELGYAPNSYTWLYEFLKKNNYTDDFLKTSGLFSQRRYPAPLFKNRLIFPVSNSAGNAIAFSARALNEDQPKYINSPETTIYKKRNTLYGLSQAMKAMREHKEVYLCEGNLDVLALAQSGFANSVAPLGTAFTKEQAAYLARYVTKVNIVFDGDAAGVNASLKAALILENIDIDCYIVLLDADQDPASILETEGKTALVKKLEKKLFAYEFVIHFYTKEHGMVSLQSKQEIYKGVKNYIESIHSQLKKELYIKELTKLLDISHEAVNIVGSDKPSKLENKRAQTHKKVISMNDELYLMVAVLLNPEFFSLLMNQLSINQLSDFYAIEIFAYLKQNLQKEWSHADVSIILNDFETDEDLKQFLYQKASIGEFNQVNTEFIESSVLKIKKRNLMDEINQLKMKIVTAESNNDQEAILTYCKKQIDLESHLKRLF